MNTHDFKNITKSKECTYYEKNTKKTVSNLLNNGRKIQRPPRAPIPGNKSNLQ